METSRTKQIVVGVMLVILTLGFCIVGTGAARPDGRPPMGDMQGFGPGQNSWGFGPGGDFAPNGQGGPGGDFAFNGQGGPGGDFAFNGQGGPGGRFGGGRHPGEDVREAIEALEDGETKTALSELFESFNAAMEKLMNADADSRAEAAEEAKTAHEALNNALKEAGITPATLEPSEKPEGEESMTPSERPEQGGPGGRNPGGDVREAIEALEDGETKTALSELLESFNAAMEKLMNADADSRAEAAEEAKTAHEALNDALKEAGITPATLEPPEKPEGENGMTPPERLERGSTDTLPQKSEDISRT